MPTINYWRLWCTECKEWTLHIKKDKGSFACRECKTSYCKIPLEEIPENKIAEQRNRYSDSEREICDMYIGDMFMRPEDRAIQQLLHMMSSPGEDVQVIEDDAGQAEIDSANRKKRMEDMQRRIEERRKIETIVKSHRGLGRNDLCTCGSGKKYKKCCLSKIEEYEQSYNL